MNDLDAIEARYAAYTDAFNGSLPREAWCSAVAGSAIDCTADIEPMLAEIRDLREQQAYAHKCMEAARVDQASRTVHQVKASILTIKPRDILVISVPKDTTQQQAHDIRKAAQAELDAHNVNAPVLIVTFDTDPKIGRLVNSSDPVTGTVPDMAAAPRTDRP